MLIKLALRELVGERRFSVLFLLNLAMGLAGFVTLDGFKRTLSDVLQGASKQILTADMSVSARRELTSDEIKTAKNFFGPGVESHKIYSLYSMAANGPRTTLVQIEAISNLHPFYGTIELEKKGRFGGGSSHGLQSDNVIWVAPELLIQLSAKVGDKLQLGDEYFVIQDVVTDDVGVSWAGASMAPRIYMGIDRLPSTNLIREGSTFWTKILYRMPDDRDVNDAESALKELYVAPGIRVRSHSTSGDNTGRMLKYLTDYLGLVALVAFFLSGVGASYLFRGYLGRKTKEIAILLSMGMSPLKAISLYSIQLIFLGVMAALLASAVSGVLVPLTGGLVADLSPVPIDPTLPWASVCLALAIGGGGAFLLCLPLLLHLPSIKAAELFQEASGHQMPKLSLKEILGLLPLLLAFYAASVWQSHSLFVGSLFMGLLLVSCLLIMGIGFGVLRGLTDIRSRSLPFKIAIRYLARSPIHAVAGFLALSVGSLLINLILQVQVGLKKELEFPAGGGLPSLFLFDIQDDQQEDLEAFISSLGTETLYTSPMVRSRITKVNGTTFNKDDSGKTYTREQEVQSRMRNRGTNLSYRNELLSSETIVKGRPFSGRYDLSSTEPAEISLEMRYAKRLGIEIGDVVTFEVQSIPIEGKVVSLRRVKWNSFQPNFFIQFQPGVLEDAPKTFISVIPKIPFDEKVAIQSAVVERFPNVSIIDVSKLVEKILSLVAQMLFVLEFMAGVAMLAGLVVLFSIANHQIEQRAWDSNLLKVLGASFSIVRRSVLIEFLLLALASSVFGGGIGLLASWGFTNYVLGSEWSMSVMPPLVTGAGLITLCMVMVSFATNRVLKRRARLYL